MPDSDSTLASHVVTLEGSTDQRVLPTQILSAAFLDSVVNALVRRGDTAVSPWLGPDQPRGFPTALGSYLAPLPGFVFQDGYGLDTTTTPGLVSLVPEDVTPRNLYGISATGRMTGLHSRRESGSVPQGSVYFDIVLGNEIGVADVPVADGSGATVYTVFLNFSTIPKTVVANPRTGVYEYTEEQTVLGVAMEPASVTDLGGGLIELVFPLVGTDMKYICSDSMAGRTATAYLANGPLTSTASAIVSGTISFSGGANRLQVSDLGQGTVSTDPADYRVIVRGMTITDYAFDLSGATGILADMDSGVLVGVLHVGAPNNNLIFPLAAPTFASLSEDLIAVTAYGTAGTHGGKQTTRKIEVRQQDYEPDDGNAQIAIRARASNPKYAGAVSWSADEEGHQTHVTTLEDFFYPSDDNTPGHASRAFTRVRSPIQSPLPLRDDVLSGAAAAMGNTLAGGLGMIWYNTNIAAQDLYFYVPLDIQNCVITEITIHRQRLLAPHIVQVDIGRFDQATGGGFVSQLSAGVLTCSLGAMSANTFVAPADFTEIAVTDAQNGEGTNAWVAKVRLRNNATILDAVVKSITLEGRQLKNFPVEV